MSVHVFEGFEVDESLFQVRSGAQVLRVRRRSFELLVYLARHADRVVSKEELIEEVWKTRAVSESSLANCVSELRTVLDDRDSSPRIIQTVYGRGYRLIARRVESEDTPEERAEVEAKPLVIGRQRECKLISRLLDEVTAGAQRVLLLSGESGSGKTLLLAEIAHEARARGLRVAEHGLDPVRERAAIEQLAGDESQVVALDDLDQATSSGVEAVNARLRSPRAGGLLLALALRALPRRNAEPLHALLGTLVRDPECVTLELGRLGGPNLCELITEYAGRALDETVSARIAERSGGRPELAATLAAYVGAAATPEVAIEAVPVCVQAAVISRVSALSARARDVLAAAAISGGEPSLGWLSEGAQLTVEACLDAVQEAIDVSLLCQVQAVPQRYAFSAPLLRDAVLAGLDASERAELHSRYGGFLERSGDPTARRHAELAFHFSHSADPVELNKAAVYAGLAGAAASRRLDHARAAEHYGRALDVLEAIGEPDPMRVCDLQIARSAALRWSFQYSEARDLLGEAVKRARAAGAVDRLAGAAIVALGPDTWGGIDRAQIALVDDALAGVEDPDSEIHSLLELAAICVRLGVQPPDEALARSREIAERARRSRHTAALTFALFTAHGVSLHSAPPAERDRLAREAMQSAATLGNSGVALLVRAGMLGHLVSTGDRTAVNREIAAIEQLSPPEDPYRLAAVALRALLSGQIETAEGVLSRLWGDALDEPWRRPMSPVFATQLFSLRREQGRLDDPHLESVLRASVGEPTAPPLWRIMLAHVLVSTGRKREGCAELDVVARLGVDSIACNGLWLVSLYWLAEAVARADHGPDAELYELLLPHADRAAVFGGFVCAGPVAHALGLLVRRSAPARAVTHFDAAIELSRQLDAGPALRRALRQRARLTERPRERPVEDVTVL